MSLMNTVTKMAIGFAMAKGMDAVNKKGGLGAVLEGLSGGSAGQAGGLGGLGEMLGQLGGSGGRGGSPGDLGDILGQLTGGGGGAAAGGLGGLGALLGGLAGARGGGSAGGLEALLNQDNLAEEPDEEDIARLMLRAMTQAARADGDIDPSEKSKLLEMLKDGDPGDMDIVQSILRDPVDAQALAADTPRGLETQVYTMSVNAIDPDNQAEGQYLHDLAGGLGITPETSNQIHDNLGLPRLYN